MSTDQWMLKFAFIIMFSDNGKNVFPSCSQGTETSYSAETKFSPEKVLTSPKGQGAYLKLIVLWCEGKNYLNFF